MALSAPAAPPAEPAGRKPLSGPEKVAALLLAMGKPLASRLLKHFDQEELRHVTRSIADLGVVPMPQLEDMIEDFAGQFAHGTGLMISANDAEISSLRHSFAGRDCRDHVGCDRQFQ